MLGSHRSGASGPPTWTRSNATSTVKPGEDDERPVVGPPDRRGLPLYLGWRIQSVQGRYPDGALPWAPAQRLARARRHRTRGWRAGGRSGQSERRDDADGTRPGGARDRELGARRGLRAEVRQAGGGKSVRLVRRHG